MMCKSLSCDIWSAVDSESPPPKLDTCIDQFYKHIYKKPMFWSYFFYLNLQSILNQPAMYSVIH